MQNRKAQSMTVAFVLIALVIGIFAIGFMTVPEREDKITGAVSGMEGVTGMYVTYPDKIYIQNTEGAWTVFAHVSDEEGVGNLYLNWISVDGESVSVFARYEADSGTATIANFPSFSESSPVGIYNSNFGLYIVQDSTGDTGLAYSPDGTEYVADGSGGWNLRTTTSVEETTVVACFLPTTPITLADGTKKQIQNIQKGDKVLSYNLKNKKPVVSTVLNVFSHLENDYLIVNNKIKVTPYHNMYINGEWKQIGNAKVGDYLMDYNGNKIKIKSIKKVYAQKGVMVYDLEIANYHYYFAEGVLVHNSEPEYQQERVVDGNREIWNDEAWVPYDEFYPDISPYEPSYIDYLPYDTTNTLRNPIEGDTVSGVRGGDPGTNTFPEEVTYTYTGGQWVDPEGNPVDAEDVAEAYLWGSWGGEGVGAISYSQQQQQQHEAKMQRREEMAYELDIGRAYPIQTYIEEWLGRDIGSEGWREWGDTWGYFRSGYETELCDEKRSRYFIQDYPGHYATDGGFPTIGAVIYAKGRRSEYSSSWASTCVFNDSSPKWFPIVAASGNTSATALGYLYKISWYIGYPFNDYDVEAWTENERESRGLERNGSIRYKIRLEGTGCSAESLESYYDMRMPEIRIGRSGSGTYSYYDKAYMTKVCVVFDRFEYVDRDGELKKEWCDVLTSEGLNVPKNFIYFPNATAVTTTPTGTTPVTTTTTPTACPSTIPPNLCSTFGYT